MTKKTEKSQEIKALENLVALEKSIDFQNSAEITSKMSDDDLLNFICRTGIRLSTSVLLSREATIRLMKNLQDRS